MKSAQGILIGAALCVAWASVAAAKPPSWDTVKVGASRFKVLSVFNNEAVLDKETGLVWQISPFEGANSTSSLTQAMTSCRTLVYNGGRYGWRLPSVEEMSTLIDTTAGSPFLPAGHPFVCTGTCSGGLSTNYWTATQRPPTDYTSAYVVSILAGFVTSAPVASIRGVWCVRGGSGAQ